MAVDTPARIAIVGAGPIGLEAALYARYLGYTVDVYERGRVCEHLQRRGPVRSFVPWEMHVTSLAIAALTAQRDDWQPANDGEFFTDRELFERYFLPLAESDLLADCLQTDTEVLGIAREGLLQSDLLNDERRADVPFRILLRDAEGNERIEHADVVLDCSGIGGTPNHLGNGGLPAIGETAARAKIEYGVPDVLDADRARYEGCRTLVVGAGHSAATTVLALARLKADSERTEITWVTRRDTPSDSLGPVIQIPGDPLPQRDALAQRANSLLHERPSPLVHRPATNVESVAYDPSADSFNVELSGRHGDHLQFDRIIANVGRRPDHRLYEELQVTPNSDAAQHVEPDFYILGSKRFGRAPGYLPTIGHEQIRALFAIVGDREGLNLYETNRRIVG